MYIDFLHNLFVPCPRHCMSLGCEKFPIPFELSMGSTNIYQKQINKTDSLNALGKPINWEYQSFSLQ